MPGMGVLVAMIFNFKTSRRKGDVISIEKHTVLQVDFIPQTFALGLI